MLRMREGCLDGLACLFSGELLPVDDRVQPSTLPCPG
jgi:hypothetical protein